MYEMPMTRHDSSNATIVKKKFVTRKMSIHSNCGHVARTGGGRQADRCKAAAERPRTSSIHVVQYLAAQRQQLGDGELIDLDHEYERHAEAKPLAARLAHEEDAKREERKDLREGGGGAAPRRRAVTARPRKESRMVSAGPG